MVDGFHGIPVLLVEHEATVLFRECLRALVVAKPGLTTTNTTTTTPLAKDDDSTIRRGGSIICLLKVELEEPMDLLAFLLVRDGLVRDGSRERGAGTAAERGQRIGDSGGGWTEAC